MYTRILTGVNTGAATSVDSPCTTEIHNINIDILLSNLSTDQLVSHNNLSFQGLYSPVEFPAISCIILTFPPIVHQSLS